MSEINITFEGGKKISAHINGFEIKTDQSPRGGGEGSAPEPFALFLASLGACAGVYVQAFCESRGLSLEGIRITEKLFPGETGGLGGILIDIETPKDFPEKYLEPLRRAADQCAVKKAILNPPELEVRTRIRD